MSRYEYKNLKIMNIFKNFRCFLGHKWNNDKTKQICLRKNCNATRVLMFKKHPKIGEPQLRWHYYNIDEIKL